LILFKLSFCASQLIGSEDCSWIDLLSVEQGIKPYQATR